MLSLFFGTDFADFTVFFIFGSLMNIFLLWTGQDFPFYLDAFSEVYQEAESEGVVDFVFHFFGTDFTDYTV